MADQFVSSFFSQVRAILFLVVCCCVVVNGGVVKRSDDVNTGFENLQILVQQQAAIINSLQIEVTAMKDKFAFLSQPDDFNSVAFTAMFSNDDGENGISLQPHATLIFDRVITNAGNGDNPTNGIFTAPVAGYYGFGLNMMEPNLSMIKTGAAVDMEYAWNSSPNLAETGSTHAVVRLAVGDQVWRQRLLMYLTVFTGYLVHHE